MVIKFITTYPISKEICQNCSNWLYDFEKEIFFCSYLRENLMCKYQKRCLNEK